MRVTIVSRIYRPEPSAASMFLGAVADELIDRGIDVTVLTARPPRSIRSPGYRERIRTMPVVRDRQGYVRGYLPYLSFDLPLAFRLLFSRRPDVVFMEPPPTTGVVVRVICALRRLPYVYDAADIWSDAAEQATSSALVVKVLRRMEAFGMRGADRLVAISQGVVDRARALGVRRPMAVTGFGADTSAFTADSSTIVQPLFVYGGSYSPWHGADILVDAFASFSERHEGYRLRFFGNGSEAERIRERASELDVEASVDVHEAVPPEELSRHLNRAVASFATQRPDTDYEYAFATKAYSSLAAGCPVLFAGPGPTGDFIDAANRSVRAGLTAAYDVEQIAAMMEAIVAAPLSPSERVELSSWTQQEHSLRAVARRVVDNIELSARTARSK